MSRIRKGADWLNGEFKVLEIKIRGRLSTTAVPKDSETIGARTRFWMHRNALMCCRGRKTSVCVSRRVIRPVDW